MPTTRVPVIFLFSSKVTYTMLQSFDPFTFRVNSLVGSFFNPFWSKVVIRFLWSVTSLTHFVILLRKSPFMFWKSSGFCSFYFYEIYSSHFRTGVCVYHFLSKEPDSLRSGNNDCSFGHFFPNSSEIFLVAVDRSFTSCYFVCQLCKFYALFRCVKAIFPCLRLQGLDCDDFGESNKLPITLLAAIIAVASRCWVHVMTV